MNQTLIFNRSKVVNMVFLFDTNTKLKLNRPTNIISSRALYTRTTEDIINNNETVSLACLQNYHFQYLSEWYK